MARSTRTIFLDANVLAAPVTRTLLLVGIEAIDIVATWSQHAETEANRHMRPRAMSVTAFRTTIWENDLSPRGQRPSRFKATKDGDRQILADAAAAQVAFLITTDVDDFGESDLVTEKIAAVNPDLFMATRFTETAYHRALTQLVTSLTHPPNTVAQMHALIGRKHPRLVEVTSRCVVEFLDTVRVSGCESRLRRSRRCPPPRARRMRRSAASWSSR